MLKRTLYLLAFALCLFSNHTTVEARGLALGNQETALPRSARLPPAFSQFSASDVLGEVFEDYNPATGRVASLLNEDQRPSLVRIDEAKLWRAGNGDFLVVLVGIASHDEDFGEGGLCGSCGTYTPLVVLRRNGNALSLVAKQSTRPYSAPSREPDRDAPDPSEAISYTGHHLSVSLDLAPYRLSSQEMLIGVRLEYMWLPALTYNTTLLLFRIEGQRIRQVFAETVIDREYSDRLPYEGTIIKTVSTVSSVPTGSQFYDLAINKTIVNCINRNDDADCGSGDRITRVRRRRELWRFNGERFIRVGQ